MQSIPPAVESSTKSERVSPTHDVWRQLVHPLNSLLSPRSIALIGATETEGSVGRTVLENLLAGGWNGPIYPINPKRADVLGIKAFPSITAAPGKVDLAVIMTPASSVPELVQECGKAGVPSALIISAGFKEIGPEGQELEKQVLAQAQKSKMRILGPNCLGVMRPHGKFNATFAAGMARPGSVGFLSQSGALCTAILDWSFRENVGFSAFVSLGSMLDVSWGDLIYYLGDDPYTKSILIYMESIGDARAFLSAAREVALTKPIIIIKVGRTEAAAKAAASHTGSMTGSDEVLHAALRRVGVLRVETIGELFDMAEVLAKQPRPKGPRLAIITNAGGPGALATDMLVTSGGSLAELSAPTLNSLNQLLPGPWSHGNPIDVLGDAGPTRYAKAVEAAAHDPNNDGLLVILTPQAMTDASGTAAEITNLTIPPGKPILASWMGANAVEAGEEMLNQANIPTFKYPDRAARAFAYMWRYSRNLRALYETPSSSPSSDNAQVSRQSVANLIKGIQKSGRTLLTEFESKKILENYGIPTVKTYIAKTAGEAVKLAEKIGYPVVLKLHSESITHKTDVGGVHLKLATAAQVRRAFDSIKSSVNALFADKLTTKAGRKSKSKPSTPRASRLTPSFLGVTVQPMVQTEGYELILGSSIDPQFGPVLLFGAGGQMVEVFKDRALGLPPLTATLARRLMESTRIYEALKGIRGRKPVDLGKLEQLLVRFSQLIVEQPWIAEMDINPLLASSDGLIALDARIVLHGNQVSEERLPKPAIRPYPVQYVKRWKLPDGSAVTLRPIRPEDEPLMVEFHKTLSEESIYYRYFTALKLNQRVAHERLTRICFNDYDREIALVVESKKPNGNGQEILGVGRLSKIHGSNEAEFALLIGDRWHGMGIGTELLKLLVEIGRKEKLERIIGSILLENRPMQHICQKVGFRLVHDSEGGQWEAVLNL